MIGSWWFGATLGAGLGLVYGGASLWINRWAMRFSSARLFVYLSVGGVVVRMLVTLSLVALVMLMLPVHLIAFIGAFFIVFVLGLALEIAILHRSAGVDC